MSLVKLAKNVASSNASIAKKEAAEKRKRRKRLEAEKKAIHQKVLERLGEFNGVKTKQGSVFTVDESFVRLNDAPILQIDCSIKTGHRAMSDECLHEYYEEPVVAIHNDYLPKSLGGVRYEINNIKDVDIRLANLTRNFLSKFFE